MLPRRNIIDRSLAFCNFLEIKNPVLMAPMAGACPPALASAVTNSGSMGACGVVTMQPSEISDWAQGFRDNTPGPSDALHMNIWVPDPTPERNASHEADVRAFLSQWGPDVPPEAADTPLANFDDQCAAMVGAKPTIISSIMGIFDNRYIGELKSNGIKWFATATTVKEALIAQSAGADAIIAQGMEAGGHRGAFVASEADTNLVGLFSLTPAIADAVEIPVVAAGGIGDARGVCAAMTLGASAVLVGTGLLRTPEAGISSAWADGLADAAPEATQATRAFSGRLGRSLRTRYTQATAQENAPAPAPYPIQRALTNTMRKTAVAVNNLDGMQAWAGQSAKLAKKAPAGQLITQMWQETQEFFSG